MSRIQIEERVSVCEKTVLPVLRKFSQHDWYELRSLSLYALGEKGVASDIVYTLPNLSDKKTRVTSLVAISRLQSRARGGSDLQGYAEKVRPFLRSDRPMDRTLAVKILGKSELSERELIPFLADDDWNVREEAATALRARGDSGAMEIEKSWNKLNLLGQFWAEKVKKK